MKADKTGRKKIKGLRIDSKAVCLAGLFLLCPLLLWAQQKMVPVVVDGDEVNYMGQENKVVARGNVSLKYKDITITCDQAEYYTDKNSASITGNVNIVSEKGRVFAENARYNFNDKTAQIDQLKVNAPPLYGRAEQGRALSEEEYILEKGFVTTCDLDQPHYRIQARTISVYPGERVTARNVVIYIGSLPVMYLPYYSQRVRDNSFPIELSPGKSSDWGYYLLSRWRYAPNESQRGKVSFDIYEDRGLGAGIFHQAESDSLGRALFNFYSIDDRLYDRDQRDELFEMYSERSAVSGKYLEDDRYKAQFAYQWQPSPDLSLRSEFNKFSDPYFRKDFFYREYEIDNSPESYFLADKSFSGSSLSLYARKRVNHFYTETEYLPKLEYNLYRRNISGDAPFYIQSDTSLGNLTRKNAYSDLDDDALRLHSHNVLSYEQRLGWLMINPYTGLYTTYYSKNTFADDDIMRLAPEAGLILSTEMYKPLDWSFSSLGEEVSQARHVIIPELRYSYIHEPTTSQNHLFAFDSIDELQRRESIVLELKNKFQTKNDRRRWDFIYFSPSIEYAFDDEGKGSYFDNIKADLEIYPSQKISLTADAFYDCQDRAVREANTDIGLHSFDNRYSAAIGHRYARNESSQGTVSASIELSPKWTFSNYVRYEFKEQNFKAQQYKVRRDLHCWWMDIGLDVDEERNYTIWFMFTVKAFPDAHFGFDHSYSGARQQY